MEQDLILITLPTVALAVVTLYDATKDKRIILSLVRALSSVAGRNSKPGKHEAKDRTDA